jgi:hypothetical protein
MNRARRLLLTTTAGLALIFAGCSGNVRSAEPPLAPVQHTAVITAAKDAPATVKTIMADYNTAASQRQADFAAEFNKNRPPGTPEIVFLDYDQVSTWFSMQEGPDRLDKAVGDWLAAKTGRTYSPEVLADLAKAMDRLQPAAFTPEGGNAGPCLIVPEFPGISFDTFYAAGFQVGAQNPMTGKTVLIRLTTQEFGDFANAHEGWHCLDGRYRSETGTGLDGALKEHRKEMFADLGGVMEGIRNGANLTLIDRIASERATWVYMTGALRAETPDGHEDHYKSIVYHTHPGLYALKSRIQEMGIDNFRKLDRAQMREIAYEITEAQALSFAEAQALESYYDTGKAGAGISGQVAQLKVITAASVRNATPAERAAQQVKAGGDGESALLAALKARAGAFGGGSGLAGKLKARQEMTDRLRGRLSSGGTPDKATEAQLNLLFYTDPHLNPRGG